MVRRCCRGSVCRARYCPADCGHMGFEALWCWDAACQLIHRSPSHRLTASQRGEAASAASCVSGRIEGNASAAFVLGARRGQNKN